MSFDNIEILGF